MVILAKYYKDELDQAIIDFDKAIAINPNFADAYGYRGLSLLALRKDSEAERDFKKCFELDESLKTVFEDLANEVKRTRRAKPPTNQYEILTSLPADSSTFSIPLSVCALQPYC